jgi:hypothetical protein
MFVFSAQHDCDRSTCDFDNAVDAASTAPIAPFTHSEDNLFVINMHAIHSASLLRRTLPRDW